ncbi:hypothetical protein [Serratia rubidaea]|uniref:hypothetical protein n=1 Tax=Serratia rubidaea TaxID=61652 RepID=UPI00177FCB16|nr:hypothetical protein [Serratia rubidaea]MBD8454097.1 hypothetical protein [Serratia rubidaea]
MPITQQVRVNDLTIDLQNYRTVPQKDEVAAIQAMITISPEYFWALMGSLIDDGYLPTENIIVIDEGNNQKIVKEGNRRIASLKIIHGYVDAQQFDIPDVIKNRISNIPQSWRQANESIPCTIYESKDSALVDKIVTLTHGKGQKAGRDDWETVARARHNQKSNASPEHGLVLLEKYLIHGMNHSTEQKLRWSGKYNLSVLDEALPKIFSRVGCSSTSDLAVKYPKVNHKKELDNIFLAIGLGELNFPAIRGSVDFLLRYGIPPISSPSSGTTNNTTGVNSPIPSPANTGMQPVNTSSVPAPTNTNSTNPQAATSGANTVKPTQRITTTSTHDIKTVRRLLRGLKLYGNNRAKLLDIKKEMIELKLDSNPIAFVFLLRCMVELSAKAFCEDKTSEPNAPSYRKKDGSEKPLGDLLRDIVDFLTQKKQDKQMVKLLHGPVTELNRPDGILSITSMNQLVHNQRFIIRSTDIPALFSSIFPIIEQMNK